MKVALAESPISDQRPQMWQAAIDDWVLLAK